MKNLVSKMSLLGVSIIVILFSKNIFAEPLPFPIPKPKVSITEAIGLATDYFQGKEPMIETDWLKKADFIIDSVTYRNYFDGKSQSEWEWYIVFRHPVGSDITYVYKVTNSKKVVLIQMTA